MDRGFGQGIKAGGLFFLASVNQFPAKLSNGCRTHLYCDDSTIEKDSLPDELAENVAIVQDNLNNIVSWSRDAGLNINPDKCSLICFGAASHVARFHSMDLSLRIDQKCVVPSKAVKHLGVWLEETLSWRKQARATTQKVLHSLRSIAHLRSSLTEATRLLLVRSLAAVHLDYCAAVLSVCDAETSRMLQVSLNSCVRYICNLSWRSHVSESRRRIGFLTAEARRKYLSLVLFFKVAYLRHPAALVETLSLTPGTVFRRGRSSAANRFVLPAVRHGSFAKSFNFSVTREWNLLPASVTSAKTLQEFKRKLMAFLVTNDA